MLRSKKDLDGLPAVVPGNEDIVVAIGDGALALLCVAMVAVAA
jgi:hypothetical protein